MKRSFACWTLAALGAAAAVPALAVTVDRQAALDALVNTEKAFAKTAGEKGTRDAFLEFLSDEAMGPDMVPSKPVWQARPAGKSLLKWFPVQADVSLAGDLGWDTGPWELRPDPAGKEVFHGFFITVWRKQADGKWKAEFDGGNDNDKPAAAVTAVKIAKAVPATVADPPSPDMVATQAALLRADRALAKQVEAQGAAAAFGPVLSDDARWHRSGAFPTTSKAAILGALKVHPEKLARIDPILARGSTSGDLGYTLGREKLDGLNGNYLRIWKKQADGSWKVVLDAFYPPPPAPPKPANLPKGHPGSH